MTMMIKKNKTIHARWDKDVLMEAKELFPKESTPTISRMLWNTSKLKDEWLKRKNKKGSIQDILFIVAFVAAIGIILLVGSKAMGSINDQFQSSTFITTEGKTASAELNGVFENTFDNLFLFIIVFLSIGSLVLAALVRVHPIFIPFFIISLLFVILIGAIASNVYEEIASNPNFSVEADNLEVTSFIITKLPLLVSIIGSLMCIILYKTWRADQLG